MNRYLKYRGTMYGVSVYYITDLSGTPLYEYNIRRTELKPIRGNCISVFANLYHKQLIRKFTERELFMEKLLK